MLTQLRLKELLHYCPDTGVFTWIKTGKLTGGRTSHNRYPRIGLDYKVYTAHRLAFMYMHGYIPKEIDHKNRDKQDNRWSNLRPCTRAQNVLNMGVTKNNTSGYTGVSCTYPHRKRPWRAYIVQDNKQQYLGVFATKEEAAEAYNTAAIEIFGEFACLNEIKGER